jgi:hypothetical protein
MDPLRAEHEMLGFFVSGVSKTSRKALHDPDHPFPFANLEYPPGTKKNHGISRGTGSC